MAAKEYKEQPHVLSDSKIFMADRTNNFLWHTASKCSK
jgi:hypothetical protein